MSFINLDDLKPGIISRLSLIQAAGVQVQWLPDERGQVGFEVDNSITLAWAAIVPLKTGGNRVSGAQTVAHILNCHGQLRRLNGEAGLTAVVRQLRALLSGWEVTGLPGHFLEFAGSEFVKAQQGDALYRFDCRFQMIAQEKP